MPTSTPSLRRASRRRRPSIGKIVLNIYNTVIIKQQNYLSFSCIFKLSSERNLYVFSPFSFCRFNGRSVQDLVYHYAGPEHHVFQKVLTKAKYDLILKHNKVSADLIIIAILIFHNVSGHKGGMHSYLHNLGNLTF
jgi:hypothetical protein